MAFTPPANEVWTCEVCRKSVREGFDVSGKFLCNECWAAPFKSSPAEKPPLGLISKDSWKEARFWDLISTLARYREANKEYPREWLTELYERLYDYFHGARP